MSNSHFEHGLDATTTFLIGQKQRQRCKKWPFLDFWLAWNALCAIALIVKICCIGGVHPHVDHLKNPVHIFFIVLYLTQTSHPHTTHLSSPHKSTSQSYAIIYNILEYHKHPPHNVFHRENIETQCKRQPFDFDSWSGFNFQHPHHNIAVFTPIWTSRIMHSDTWVITSHSTIHYQNALIYHYNVVFNRMMGLRCISPTATKVIHCISIYVLSLNQMLSYAHA